MDTFRILFPFIGIPYFLIKWRKSKKNIYLLFVILTIYSITSLGFIVNPDFDITRLQFFNNPFIIGMNYLLEIVIITSFIVIILKKIKLFLAK